MTTLPKAKELEGILWKSITVNVCIGIIVAFHSVDDNNTNYQGCISFDETFRPVQWDLHPVGFIFALHQVNGMLAFIFLTTCAQTNLSN